MNQRLSWGKLAEALGTTPRSLNEWRAKFTDCPPARDSEKWRAFMRERGLGHYSLRRNAPLPPVPSDAESAPTDEQVQLRFRRLKVDTERAEWELNRERDRHLPVSDFENALRVTRAAFKSALDAFAGQINPLLEGLDFCARAEVLEEQMNLLRSTLAQCAYLGAGPDAIPAAPARDEPTISADDPIALRHRRLKADTERAEWEFERQRSRHFPIPDFECALRDLLTAFVAAASAFAGRVNPGLEGLGFDTRTKVLEKELNIMRRILDYCNYPGADPSPALDAPANANPPPVADLKKPRPTRERAVPKASKPKRKPSKVAKRKAVRRAASKARARSRR